MTRELFYLALVTLLTALLWVPYVLNRLQVWGLADTVGYPADPKPLAPWAERARKAHANAVENLVLFATVVIVAHVLNKHTGASENAAAIYFWSRLVHVIAYIGAVPWLRTVAFVVGWLACLDLIWHIFYA